MDPVARLFICACCRQLRVICPRCDRGNRYCCRARAADARRQSVRAAGRRYQASRRGRFAHAARQLRYRARQIVTHQGSPPAPVAVSLPAPVAGAVSAAFSLLVMLIACHVCGQPCASFVRRRFLRRGTGSSRSKRPHSGALARPSG